MENKFIILLDIYTKEKFICYIPFGDLDFTKQRLFTRKKYKILEIL